MIDKYVRTFQRKNIRKMKQIDNDTSFWSFHSRHRDAIVYCILFSGTMAVNKYVLSVLEFTYPTIYQGWQTLVGLILFTVLRTLKFTSRDGTPLTLTALDRSGVINLLPLFIFYVGAIVAGSKALAALPVPVILTTSNVLPSFVYLLDCGCLCKREGLLAYTAAVISISSGLLIVTFGLDFSVEEEHILWLFAHVFFSCGYFLYNRISDPRFSEIDKLYFCYIFSVIVLAPSSLYLEEAFQVLDFRYLRQIHFYVLCFLSGVLNVALNLWLWYTNRTSMKTNKSNIDITSTQKICAVAKCVAAFQSVFMFVTDFSVVVWLIIVINLTSSVFIPLKEVVITDDNLEVI